MEERSSGAKPEMRVQPKAILEGARAASRESRPDGDIVWQNRAGSEASMCRYAWLELEGGMWCLLTHLWADPRESTRTWPDRLRALEELIAEGWMVVRPYPQNIPGFRQSGGGVSGYGLMRAVQ